MGQAKLHVKLISDKRMHPKSGLKTHDKGLRDAERPDRCHAGMLKANKTVNIYIYVYICYKYT